MTEEDKRLVAEIERTPTMNEIHLCRIIRKLSAENFRQLKELEASVGAYDKALKVQEEVMASLRAEIENAPKMWLKDACPGQGIWIEADHGSMPGTDATHVAELVRIKKYEAKS